MEASVNEHVRDVLIDPAVLGHIRRATLDDLPFFAELIQNRYGDRFHDPQKANANSNWLALAFERPDFTCLRGTHTAGVARVVIAYGAELLPQLVGMAAWPGAGLEPLRMLRVMLRWAKVRGATGDFAVSADTGVDFAPFAKRLGGRKVIKEVWEIPLE